MFKSLAEDEEKYLEFYKEFGGALKMGILEDAKTAPKLIKLLRFHSSKSGKMISIEDYVKNMKEGQEQIFYIIGDSVKALSSSPFVETLLSKGYEILVRFLIRPFNHKST